MTLLDTIRIYISRNLRQNYQCNTVFKESLKIDENYSLWRLVEKCVGNRT